MKYVLTIFVNGCVHLTKRLTEATYCFVVHSFFYWEVNRYQSAFGPKVCYRCDRCYLEWFTKYDG